MVTTATKNNCLCKQSGYYCLAKVCWRSLHGWATDLFPLFLFLHLYPPPHQSNVIQSLCVPADRLAVPSWLPSNGWAAAYMNRTPVRSIHLHLNDSDANQQRVGAIALSTDQNLAYFTMCWAPQVHLIWFLKIWNTAADCLKEVPGIAKMYATLIVQLGPITLSLLQPIIHSSFSSHIKFTLILKGSWYKLLSVSLYNLFFFKQDFLSYKNDKTFTPPC